MRARLEKTRWLPIALDKGGFLRAAVALWPLAQLAMPAISRSWSSAPAPEPPPPSSCTTPFRSLHRCTRTVPSGRYFHLLADTSPFCGAELWDPRLPGGSLPRAGVPPHDAMPLLERTASYCCVPVCGLVPLAHRKPP